MKFEDQSLHSPSKLEKLCELLVVATIKHDLPFQFVEYEGIRALFSYKCEDIELVSTNTIKADVFSMYKRENVRLMTLLHSIPGRKILTSDLWTSIAMKGMYV